MLKKIYSGKCNYNLSAIRKWSSNEFKALISFKSVKDIILSNIFNINKITISDLYIV